MLVLSKEDQLRQHNEAKSNLTEHFNSELGRILNENGSKDLYWILGKVKFPIELGGFVGRTFLQACDEKPPVVKDAFLYEVDNRRGVKTLLWVMHPNGSLRLPTLGKTIQATSAKKRTIISA